MRVKILHGQPRMLTRDLYAIANLLVYDYVPTAVFCNGVYKFPVQQM